MMLRVRDKIAAAAAFGALVMILVVPAATAAVPETRTVNELSGLTVGHAHFFPAVTVGPHRAAMNLAAAASGGNLQYKGGVVQHDPTFYAVWWLPSGSHFETLRNGLDSSYESLMKRFLGDATSTNLSNLLEQYYDGSGNIQPGSTFGGDWTDTTPYPHSGSSSDPIFQSDIEASVQRALDANPSWKTGDNAEVFVFTASGINSCFYQGGDCTPPVNPTAAKSYCAFHSYFSSNRGYAIYANMPLDQSMRADLGGGNAVGCYFDGFPNDDSTADSEFSALSHELIETITDPYPNTGWVDSNDDEIGDKCAYNFGTGYYFEGANVSVGGDLYRIQQEWSNVNSGCAGFASPSTGFYAPAYGPYAAYAGKSTPTIHFGLSTIVPSVDCCGAPANPTINWGDGSSSQADQPGGCVTCELTGTHVYQSGGTYDATVTYWTACCISYSTTVRILVFPKPTLTVTVNSSGEYGTAPSLSGLSPGNSAIGYSPGSEASNVTGTLTCSTSATSSSPVGSYPISGCSGLADSGFDIVYDYANSHYSVTKAPLTVAADGQSRPYGSANAPLTATVSGFVLGQNLATSGVGGAAACTTAATASSPVGSYTISCTQGTLSSANYSFGPFVPGTLTVTKVALTVTADAQSRPYASPNPPLTATLSGFVLGQSLATSGVTGTALCTTTVTQSDPAGGYPITCTQGILSSTNYSFGPFVPGTLTVTKVPLTVTADDQTRPYGSANPSLTATLSGFVSGETLAGSDVTGTAACATTATSSSSGGAYPITCTQGTLDSADYSFGPFVPGTLSITKVALTVTADTQTRLFGAANPPLTATLSGFVSGESLVNSDVTGAAACTTTATSWSPAGSYQITCTQGTLSSADYSFGSFVPATLAVKFSTSCVSGTPSKLTVSSVQAICVAPGTLIRGGVTVLPGGSLDLEGAKVTGGITATAAAVIRICGSSTTGGSTITGNSRLVLIGGDAATGPCAANKLSGPFDVTNNLGGVEFNGNTVSGSLTITGNGGALPTPDSGPVHAVGNTVSGKSKIQ
jgi:hypothetical protein